MQVHHHFVCTAAAPYEDPIGVPLNTTLPEDEVTSLLREQVAYHAQRTNKVAFDKSTVDLARVYVANTSALIAVYFRNLNSADANPDLWCVICPPLFLSVPQRKALAKWTLGAVGSSELVVIAEMEVAGWLRALRGAIVEKSLTGKKPPAMCMRMNVPIEEMASGPPTDPEPAISRRIC